MIKATDFIHPEDGAALRQLESIPGFPTLVKKLMSMGLEQLQYGVNMASAIRLSPSQLPKLYNRLPPICKKLGIEQPEFYLSMDPNPNAWTFGDTKIFTIDPTIAHYGTSLFYLLCIVASVFNKNWVILLMELILSFTVFFVNAHFSQGYTGKNLHLDENEILTDSFVFK